MDNTPKKNITLYLLRHCITNETTWKVEENLLPIGLNDAKNILPLTLPSNIDIIFSSPYSVSLESLKYYCEFTNKKILYDFNLSPFTRNIIRPSLKHIISHINQDVYQYLTNTNKDNDILFPEYLENDDYFDERIDKFLFRFREICISHSKPNINVLLCADPTVIDKICKKFDVSNIEIPLPGQTILIRNIMF